MRQRILASLIILTIVLSLLPIFISPESVYAASTTLITSKDTYISGYPSESTNHGTATDLLVGTWTYGFYPVYQERERTLVEFPKPWGATVPVGSTITSVWLQLYYYSYDKASALMPDPIGQPIYAQRLLRVGPDFWLEAQANWNRYVTSANWASAGAAGSGTDYTTTDQAIAMVPGAFGWVDWDVTMQVQTARTDNKDIAFRITAPDLETQGTVLQFYSGAYANSNYWPRLVINYIPPSAPSVGTIGADNITYNSARCYGKIIDEGSATVTIRGFKYGLAQSDTWDIHQTGTFTFGEYSLNLTSLLVDTTYYFRAYATNTYGTGYGSWESFTTATGVPIVTTDSVYVYSYCTGINAIMGGTITSIGNSTVTMRGFQYGLTPVTAGGNIHEHGFFGTGAYNLTEFISSNASYWFRAYATNTEGTGFGIWKPFYPTGGIPSDCSGGGGANVTGSGTSGNPYVIWSVYGLQEMQNHLSSYWELGCNINATATETWNWDAGRGVYEGFVPISAFSGHFDGNWFAITGLYENEYSVSGLTIGLFGSIAGATITNILIIDANIIGYTEGITPPCHIGVLVGYISSSSVIQEVYVSGNVSGTCNDTGGVGYANLNCGGLVGTSAFVSTTISKCASYVNVQATALGEAIGAAGGLVGLYKGSSSTINNCYARGSVYGTNRAGGLVGWHYTSGSIDNCYSTGLVTGGGNCGGLVGINNLLTTDSFWDTQTSGQATSAGGTGKNTTEMKTESTFTAAGWDFDTIWGMDPLINDGYPYLRWALTTPPQEATQYTLTLSSTVGGNVTVPGEGEFTYDYGQVVSLVATPDEGYRFAMWVGDITEVADSHSATTTVTMTNSFSIMAVFVPEGKLALYITSTDGGDVTDPGEGLFAYDPSDIVVLEATADGGYAFAKWSGETDSILGIYDATTAILMLDDYAIVANFVTSGNYALIISSTDGGDVVIPGEGMFEYAPDTVVDLVAQPNLGCWFIDWEGDVGTIADINSATTNITMTGNYTIMAVFGGEVEFDLTISSSEGGDVTDPGEGTFTYNSSQIVNLTAMPDEGYEFFAWTGDTGTIDDVTAAMTTITMHGDYAIVANFEPVEECSLLLSLSSTEGGVITAPGPGVFTFPCGSEVTITAQAYEGWWFKEWTGDIDNIANPLSFNTTILMADDAAIMANFIEEEAPPEGVPTVVTHNASSIASTSAWLNGELTSLGNYTQGYVFFNYGLNTSYGTNTPSQLLTTTDNFTRWISNLATNTTYHFRAVCQYDSYVYGDDKEFTTSESEVCETCLWAGIHSYESFLTGDNNTAPVYGSNWYGQTFTISPESHSIVDVRFKAYRVGTPSTVTVSIRACGDDGLPVGDDLTSGTLDGDIVTNSTSGDWYGVALTETSLSYGELYAICIRAEAGDEENYLAVRIDTNNGYDGGYGIAPGAESGGVIWVADSDNDIMFQVDGQALIRVMDARVFNDYLEDDDMLVVLSYLNTYVPYYPDGIASLHFWLQLRSPNGDAVLAQSVCQQWGYMPGSIYLNANQAASLTLGLPYRVYLYGTSSEHPVACYQLAPTDWLGNALGLLCPWVISTAHAMATYYGTPMTTQVQNKEVLNSEGGTLFQTGISSLLYTNPECFSDLVYTPGYNPITPGPSSFDTATTWQLQVGPVIAELAIWAGGFINLDGKYAIDIGLFILYLIICGLIVKRKGDPIIGTFLCVPLLLGAAWLRVIDFQLIAAIGAVAVLMTVYRFAWSRT